MTTPTDRCDVELRNRIAYALSNAGAYCGDCDFEPGDRGKCEHCEQHWTWCADNLLPLVAAERAAVLREEAEIAERTAAALPDGLREVATGARAVADRLRARADAIRPQDGEEA